MILMESNWLGWGSFVSEMIDNKPLQVKKDTRKYIIMNTSRLVLDLRVIKKILDVNSSSAVV